MASTVPLTTSCRWIDWWRYRSRSGIPALVPLSPLRLACVRCQKDTWKDFPFPPPSNGSAPIDGRTCRWATICKVQEPSPLTPSTLNSSPRLGWSMVRMISCRMLNAFIDTGSEASLLKQLSYSNYPFTNYGILEATSRVPLALTVDCDIILQINDKYIHRICIVDAVDFPGNIM